MKSDSSPEKDYFVKVERWMCAFMTILCDAYTKSFIGMYGVGARPFHVLQVEQKLQTGPSSINNE